MKTDTKNKILTANVLEISFGDDVNAAIIEAKKSYMTFSFTKDHPQRPEWSRDFNSAQAKEYAKELEAYEKADDEFFKTKKTVREYNNAIDAEVIKYIKEISGFNKYIPEDKKDRVWSKAWDDGHSNGLYEVYLELLELINLFK